MSEKLPVLSVQMFGRPRITYGEQSILSGKSAMSKAQKLLLLLIYSGPAGIERSRLLEALYGREEILDAGNNLRVTLHRLKKFLGGGVIPDWDYVTVSNGIYRWSSPMPTEVDALVFRELTERAEHTPERAERVALLKRACEMYDGEFLQTLSGEEWVLLESVQYKNLYEEALSEVCDWLIEQEEYEEAIRLCTPACEMYPLDEWQGVRMECYIAMGQYEEAYREYEETARVLFEELGISPSKKMLEHLRTIGGHVNGAPRSVQEIREDLTKIGEEEGAIYCSLPSFRDVYCMMRRIMEREGQSIYLMLCTITDGKGYVQKNRERLGKMSERLYDAIKYSLRRCDSFTRYNSAQFLVLLVGTSLENCGQISERITRYFTKGHKTWGNYLDCQVASIADMEFGGPGFSFLKQI